jgi:hypothetical protein
MTLLIHTSHRVAAALSVICGVLAVIAGSQYLRQHGGLDISSGSDDEMTVMLLVLGCVLAGSFALLRPGGRNLNGARLTSIVWSLTILLCLLFTWRVIAFADRWTVGIGTPIASEQDFAAFAAAYPKSFDRYRYRVPTGAFLQSFEFLNSNNVEMTGYIWQFYSDDIPDDITRGVVFPEALQQAYEMTQSWRVRQEGGELIGCYFSGTFRQSFDYRLYPFDRQAVWLRLWHPDPERIVLLTPDLDAYSETADQALLGIENRFVYGGWDPVRSGFSYEPVTYNTNFGLGPNFGLGGQLNGTPLINLYFTLSVERDSLGPLLEHLVLEGAIAILLFLMLLLMSHGADTREHVGLTIFDLIVAAGALLFAVILDHNAIRDAVESQELTYLEYFPLILDVFIVLVVLSAVLRVQGWRVPLLGYTGDLVPVLAYWPALLGTLLTVTLLMFFY